MKKKILKTVMVLSVILVFSASVLAYIENPRKKCWKPFDKLEVGTLDPQGQSNNLQSGGSLDKTPPIID